MCTAPLKKSEGELIAALPPARRLFLLRYVAAPSLGVMTSALAAPPSQSSEQPHVSVDDFGATPDSDIAASVNGLAFKRALDAAAEGSKVVLCGAGKTYWLPSQFDIGRPGVTLDGKGATLVQASGVQTLNWLLITKCNGFKIKNLVIDGNRAGATKLGRDASLLVIFNVEDVDVVDIVVRNSAAKGLSITSSTAGTGTRRIRVSGVKSDHCKYQALMTDRSNGGHESPACEDIVFDRVQVGDTEHAGIAVNDGSRRVTVSNSVLDINNATWDALSIRGSTDVTVTRTIGRRGRNGCGISVLDPAALGRGEDTSNIRLSNNVWELNTQNGCLIAGATGVTIREDVARNNGQGGKGAGFNVTQVARTKRSTDVTLDRVMAIDDQPRPTQAIGVSVASSDHVRVKSPVIRGNSSKNKVEFLDSSDGTVNTD